MFFVFACNNKKTSFYKDYLFAQLFDKWMKKRAIYTARASHCAALLASRCFALSRQNSLSGQLVTAVAAHAKRVVKCV